MTTPQPTVKGPVATNKQRYQVSFDVEQLVNGQVVTIAGNKYAVATIKDIIAIVSDVLIAKLTAVDPEEVAPDVGSKN